MNQFYYETRGKEKIRELQAEGIRSQAYHRTGAPRMGIFHGLQKLLKVIQGQSKEKQAQSAKAPHSEPAQPELG